MSQYAYSFDEEEFFGTFDSREEALDEAAATRDGTVVLTGRCEPYTHRVDPVPVIEAAQDRAYDTVGPWADDWLTQVKPEHVQRLADNLTAVFRLWLREFGYEPTFFTATDVEEHVLPESE